MKAVIFDEYGGPEVLKEAELPDPVPGPEDVVIEVEAVCVGRLLDIGARAGRLPFLELELPHVLGAEHAGRVAALGDSVTDLSIGDRVSVFPVVTCGDCAHCVAGFDEACADLEVMGVHRQGSYAELSLTPRANVNPLPDALDVVNGAALALGGPVAWQQLKRTGVSDGTWVLVQAAGSALGSVTAALAASIGARVIATSRQQSKRDLLGSMGMEAVLDWSDPDFNDEVSDLTGGEGVAVVIDNIGSAEMFAKSISVLGRSGTLILSGAFIGDQPSIDLRTLYTLSQSIVGMRTATLSSAHEFWENLDPDFRPVVDRTFPLSEAPEAHAYVEADENFGRVALVR